MQILRELAYFSSRLLIVAYRLKSLRNTETLFYLARVIVYCFAYAHGWFNQELENILSEIKINFCCLLNHILASVNLKAIHYHFSNLTDSLKFLDREDLHKFCNLIRVELEESQPVRFVKVTTNLCKELVAGDPARSCKFGNIKDHSTDLISNIHPTDIILHCIYA